MKDSTVGSAIIFSFFIISILTLVIPSLIVKNKWFNTVFGDGLTQEQITASLGQRKADLLIRMIPPVVTTETLQGGQKPFIEFRLFDPATNQPFSHVTYYIIIEKDGKRLLFDLFHDHGGDLKIQIKPNNMGNNITIDGGKVQPLDVWSSTPDRYVTVSGPIFLAGGLYHFIVKILTVDSDTAFLAQDKCSNCEWRIFRYCEYHECNKRYCARQYKPQYRCGSCHVTKEYFTPTCRSDEREQE